MEPLLSDLSAFCARDDLPAVAQAAVAHVQFETIHPYFDGNGRVGRALIQVILRRRGIARTVLPPVSLVLAGARDRYVEGLTAFRRGDAGAWLATFNDAVFRAARAGEELAASVGALQGEWAERAGQPRRDSAAAALIRRLPEEPIVDLATARRLTGRAPRRRSAASTVSPTRTCCASSRAGGAVACGRASASSGCSTISRRASGDRAGAAPDNRENLRFCGVDCGPRPRSPHKGEQRE